MRLWLLVLIVCWSMVGKADPGLFQLQGKPVAKIPFHLFDNKIVVPVKVNDLITLNFILDTGVTQPMLLDKRWGKTLGLDYVREIKFHGAGDQTAVKGRVSVPSVKMEMGGVVGEQMTIVALDYDALKLSRYDIHGILGTQLFMRFVVKVDYANRLLWVAKCNRFREPDDFIKLNMELVNLKTPHKGNTTRVR